MTIYLKKSLFLILLSSSFGLFSSDIQILENNTKFEWEISMPEIDAILLKPILNKNSEFTGYLVLPGDSYSFLQRNNGILVDQLSICIDERGLIISDYRTKKLLGKFSHDCLLENLGSNYEDYKSEDFDKKNNTIDKISKFFYRNQKAILSVGSFAFGVLSVKFYDKFKDKKSEKQK